MSQPFNTPWEEVLICSECDSKDPIETKRVGDESFFYCPACQSVEGRTRAALINVETDEVREIDSDLPKPE